MSEKENKIDLSSNNKATEAMLRSVILPESAVNRDGLMYEAGYAAGIASFDAKTSVGLAQSKKTNAIWPALTATFAATAAVCLTILFLQQEEPPKYLRPSGVVASSGKANTTGPTVEAAIEIAPRGNPVELFFGFLPERRYRDWMSNAIRELETDVTPVSWEADGASPGVTEPLTPGKSVDVNNMIDGLH